MRLFIGLWVIGNQFYATHTGLTLEPCQAQAPLASFKTFGFRKSVLGAMRSSQEAVSRGFHLHPLERVTP